MPQHAVPPSDGPDGPATPRPVFVLHDHRRPRPHFDLRLEEDGVLRSWAVPRGLPPDARHHRLAIPVPDHDLDHATYEDDQKFIADTGWWEEHDRSERRMIFTLHGRTGSRRYALIHTDPDWLLRLTKDQPGGRWVLHVDLDEFIAAVEVLRRPELAGLPVVVGGDGDPAKRGVVSTASYAARAFGVRSGMPLRTAARRCPDAVFLPVDKPEYEAASEQVMATLREFGAVVEVIGWDEAFLGVVTDDPQGLAVRIAARVLAATRLSCSVGIGQNKLQAKLATGFGKPAGVFTITSQTWFELLGMRSPDVLQGIGSRTAKKLAEMGISTVQELAAADDAQLAARFGPTIGPWLGRTGRGRDPSPVVGDPWVPRSRSREVTFQQDLDDWEQVRAEITRLASLVHQDVSGDGRPIGRVGIKLRWVPFTTQTRARALPAPTLDAVQLLDSALAVLEGFGAEPDGTRRKVRLAGVRYEFA